MQEVHFCEICDEYTLMKIVIDRLRVYRYQSKYYDSDIYFVDILECTQCSNRTFPIYQIKKGV